MVMTLGEGGFGVKPPLSLSLTEISRNVFKMFCFSLQFDFWAFVHVILFFLKEKCFGKEGSCFMYMGTFRLEAPYLTDTRRNRIWPMPVGAASDRCPYEVLTQPSCSPMSSPPSIQHSAERIAETDSSGSQGNRTVQTNCLVTDLRT